MSSSCIELACTRRETWWLTLSPTAAAPSQFKAGAAPACALQQPVLSLAVSLESDAMCNPRCTQQMSVTKPRS